MNPNDYTHCELCPRRCGVDRTRSVGFCGVGASPQIARAALHPWEEPCISGEKGSGTVFFKGCTLSCVFCQNAEISQKTGVTTRIDLPAPPPSLVKTFRHLADIGAENINLVTPTMFSPDIIEAVAAARSLGMTLPVVYNTSGYERADIIRRLSGTVDIWLPDFKYLSSDLAARYSSAADYPDAARTSLAEMVRLTGKPVIDQHGIMTRGVIVRHLMLPGQLAESKRVIAYLFGEYGNRISYSLMSQYTPTGALDTARYPELKRRVTTYEYQKLIDYALSLGMTNAYIQDGDAVGESFIPAFNGEGVL